MNNNLLFQFTPDKTNHTITVRREFMADKQLVWDCYTKSELLDQWFAPTGMTTKTKSHDFSEGGHWHYALVEPGGNEYWNYTEYLTIQPIDYYTSTDAFSNENGDINPDFPRSEMKTDFTEKGDHTIVQVIVQYSSLNDLEKVIEMGVEYGMTLTLSKLDELLAKLTS